MGNTSSSPSDLPAPRKSRGKKSAGGHGASSPEPVATTSNEGLTVSNLMAKAINWTGQGITAATPLAKEASKLTKEYGKRASVVVGEAYEKGKVAHGPTIAAKAKEAQAYAARAGRAGMEATGAAAQSTANAAAQGLMTAATAAGKEAVSAAKEVVPNALNATMRKVIIIVIGSAFAYGLATSIPGAYVEHLKEKDRREKAPQVAHTPPPPQPAASATTGAATTGGWFSKTEEPAPAPVPATGGWLGFFRNSQNDAAPAAPSGAGGGWFSWWK